MHQCLIHATSFGVRFNVWYEWYDWGKKLKRRFKLLSSLLTVIDFDCSNESYNEVIFKTSYNIQKYFFVLFINTWKCFLIYLRLNFNLWVIIFIL